jgi:RNA polymerase sigma-70 factor (ECF subfamily)
VKREDEGSLAGFNLEIPGATSLSLLERAKRGDRASRERLCRLYGRLVWSVYLARVPEQDRMDLCQEVFRTVFQRIHEFRKARNDGPAFRAWLHQIAVNKMGNYRSSKRRQGITVSHSDLEGLIQPGDNPPRDEGSTELTERAELIRGAFDEAASGFEPRTVEAVRRVVFGDEPVHVVAVALAMSHNAIHIAKSRVLARVRAILADLGEPLDRAAKAL